MKGISALRILPIYLLAGSITTLTACSSGGGDDATADLQTDALNTLLNGTWVTSCLVGPDISILLSLTYNNGKGSAETTTFSDTTCSNISSIENETFDYSFGNELTVDGTVADLTVATEINSTTTTSGSLSFGEFDFDIFAIKDLITLYLGDSLGANDASSPALRPTQLLDFPLTRQ